MPSRLTRGASSWRCPDCRTLQAETTHCWRCSKAAHTCESCHLYRASVAAGIGYCANDPVRTPLRADEGRACWEATPTPVPDDASRPPVPSMSRASRKAKPPLEEPGRAAWVEPGHDRLVDAPLVDPVERSTSERQRRTWLRWFR